MASALNASRLERMLLQLFAPLHTVHFDMLRVRSPGCSADVGARDSGPGIYDLSTPAFGIEKIVSI
jgi:hypothetical protein